MRKTREILTRDELYRRRWEGMQLPQPPAPTVDPIPYPAGTHHFTKALVRGNILDWSREQCRSAWKRLSYGANFDAAELTFSNPTDQETSIAVLENRLSEL